MKIWVKEIIVGDKVLVNGCVPLGIEIGTLRSFQVEANVRHARQGENAVGAS